MHGRAGVDFEPIRRRLGITLGAILAPDSGRCTVVSVPRFGVDVGSKLGELGPARCAHDPRHVASKHGAMAVRAPLERGSSAARALPRRGWGVAWAPLPRRRWSRSGRAPGGVGRLGAAVGDLHEVVAAREGRRQQRGAAEDGDVADVKRLGAGPGLRGAAWPRDTAAAPERRSHSSSVCLPLLGCFRAVLWCTSLVRRWRYTSSSGVLVLFWHCTATQGNLGTLELRTTSTRAIRSTSRVSWSGEIYLAFCCSPRGRADLIVCVL